MRGSRKHRGQSTYQPIYERSLHLDIVFSELPATLYTLPSSCIAAILLHARPIQKKANWFICQRFTEVFISFQSQEPLRSRGTSYVLFERRLFTYGLNVSGQLGYKCTKVHTDSPQWVPMPAIASIYVGRGCFGAPLLSTRHTNSIAVFGVNQVGQLGIDRRQCILNTPHVVPIPGEVSRVSFFPGLTVVFCQWQRAWFISGDNTKGQLGVGDTNPRTGFVKVNVTGVQKIIGIDGRVYLAVESEGKRSILAAGDNRHGCLGVDSTSPNLTSFTPIKFHSNFNPSRIKGGPLASFFIGDGVCYAAGENSFGRLGVGHASKIDGPTRLPFPVYDVIISRNITVFRSTAGTLLCAGDNRTRPFPFDSETLTHPQPITATWPISRLILGNMSVFIQRGDGPDGAGVWYCRGYNPTGQLGVKPTRGEMGEVVSSWIPVKAGHIENIFRIPGIGALFYQGRKEDGVVVSGDTSHPAVGVAHPTTCASMVPIVRPIQECIQTLPCIVAEEKTVSKYASLYW
ncbi:hypothetical protein J8273_1902 [Carpediemonas membranifera]|uniref:Uncharacterized protein n=1 Tax=Carpediemonas membranifera TaxID=201153 RepID=A0A8J6B279_9EUKA|nr:hypothetical protein J8273_1902 [Carpediemonas membranifera]|eukprot:KAG9396855.1 hypothetical protein J8273_1902 [Carpediemonas membranifera]